MELFCRYHGAGEQVVVLVHGLYGSSSNWVGLTARLKDSFRVIAPDLRNHGQSPHHHEHTYEAMANDLAKLIREQAAGKVILVGHSMGGKVCMRLALDYPGLVEKLVVIDIAPRDYGLLPGGSDFAKRHQEILAAMQALENSHARGRAQAEKFLEQSIADKRLRDFLMKNLKPGDDGYYHWQLNISALRENMAEIVDGFSGLSSNAKSYLPAIFIKGGGSNYIREDDYHLISKMFPASAIVVIPGAGHWVHADQPGLFIDALVQFITSQQAV